MTYQALARKWRPRRFPELVGQGHIVRALTHALDEQRLHQALLFSGTRGVGKTTLGRIVAKCLNCERGISSEPCVDEPCRACAEIDAGRFIDLIEVDAASRTGVDDTRELMDNVQYAPTHGRTKVYLIDEVHMLSKHAFNALLKTLEEPPPHVQFLLATTDPQKLPVTILSRCLQFPLKRLPTTEITDQLGKIVEAESVSAEPQALAELARAADGSMRDALSLLDQAIAFGGGSLSAGEVRDMLGGVAREELNAILEAIAAGDGTALMAALERLDERAPDYAGVIDDLAASLHAVAVRQVVPGAAGDDEADTRLDALAAQLPAEDVQLYYDIAVTGRRDLDWAPDPKSGLEMTCLRMLAFRPAGKTGGAGPGGAETAAKESAAPQPGRATNAEAAPSDEAAPTQQAAGSAGGEWERVIESLGLSGMTAQLAHHCVARRLDADGVELGLPAALEHLLTDKARKQLQSAIVAHYGADTPVRIELGDAAGESPAKRAAARDDARREAAERAIDEDPTVQALQQRFGDQLRRGDIEPADEHSHSKRG